ncbi:MAG: hypothetical protein O7F69_07230, partial [Alphaproteobacteria bacterium]|nr:hypothetical protein [Alphaproteobacteria bacterium]
MSLEILADAKAYTLKRVAVEQERAHLKALKLRAKMVDKTFDPRRKNGPEPVPTLERYLDDSYGPWVKLNRSDGAATIGRIKACFLEPFGCLPINQITSELVEDWRTSRIEAGILPSTINRDTGALRACLSHKGKRAYKVSVLVQSP